MLKHLLLFLIIFQSAFAAKLSIDERRRKIIGIVDEELAEVTRLSKQQNNKVPDTLFRMAELNLEKARLYREMENEQYLAIPVEQRKTVNKNDFFARSSKLFQEANKVSLLVEKRFPKYKNIGDVHYILAYNYQELGNKKLAQKYFGLASRSSKDPKILAKSRLALADYYYHDHKYKEAIPLYEASVGKLDEKWWTRDAFNLAWSYYRVRNYDRAISLMLEVHQKSRSGKYVDMRSSVERDIGIFYVDAKRMDDAVRFYEGIKLNYTEQFIRIANAIVAQGRFEQAEKLLDQVKKSEKDQKRINEIILAQLNIFEKFNRNPQHLAASKELVAIHKKHPLEKSQFDRLSFQVNKQAAELQKATTSKVYQSVPKARRQKANEAMAYFALAAELDPKGRSEKIFYQAETAYATGLYAKSLSLYIESFDGAKTANDSKLVNQNLEGMLSALGQPSLNKKTQNKYYVPVYSRYLSVDKKSERAKTIYVKLFNSQYDLKDIAGAEQTLADYAKSFPQDFKTQEAMLAKVMEYYREKKDYGKVKAYVGRINNGEFKVSKKYANALRSLMTKIQIEGVQQSLDKGDKAVALQGYHQIYDSDESTPKAKVNASYNLAALYYELGETQKSYQWSTIALKDMEVSDVAKFSDSFLSIAAGLFLRQQFAQSSDLSHRMLAKLCNQNSSNKVVAYKNAAFIALSNGDVEKAMEIKDFGKQCHVQDAAISEVSFEILKDLARERRWEAYEKTISDLEKNSKNAPALIVPYEELRTQYRSIGSEQEAQAVYQKQTRFYEQARAQKLDIPVEALDLISSRMLSSVLEKKARLDKVELKFPEAVFNSAVKQKLQILDQMTSDVNAIQKVGSGKGIVEAYKYVIEAYEKFGNELKAFVPEGKAPEYVASFQKAMAEVHRPILQNANKQRREIKNLIYKNSILSFSNYSVLYSELESFKRYYTEKEAVLMDRGGKK